MTTPTPKIAWPIGSSLVTWISIKNLGTGGVTGVTDNKGRSTGIHG